MSVTIFSGLPYNEHVEANLSNTSFIMLLDLIAEYGAGHIVARVDRECLCNEWNGEEAEIIAATLLRALADIPDRDNVVEKTTGARGARCIGPAEHVAPVVWFGGTRRAQVEAVIDVLNSGPVVFG